MRTPAKRGGGGAARSGGSGAKRRRLTLAGRADKYKLYQRSVQAPDHEAGFVAKLYQKYFARSARVLREDFCGTFAICCEWIRQEPRTQRGKRRAVGVDLDSEPLDWGRANNLAQLSENQRRQVTLIQDDVRSPARTKADIICAENFSYWIFKTRDELRRYFKAAYDNLGRKGLFILDTMGGSEVIQDKRRDVKRYRGFTYIWEQARFNPITHDGDFYITFRFKDGSSLKRAFAYHWRVWMLPEIRELLLEAGFAAADVYWEGTDAKTGEGDGKFRKVAGDVDNDLVYIAYIVGVKK